MLAMSPGAKQELTRILLIQQSDRISASEKTKKLDRILKEMAGEVREEITRHFMSSPQFMKYAMNGPS